MNEFVPRERTITRRALFDLVWTRPLGDAAAELSLESVTLKQLCADHEIPRPQSGHWTRVRYGNHVEIPALGTASRSELESVDLGPTLTRPKLAQDDPACAVMRVRSTQLVAKTRAAILSCSPDARGLRTATTSEGFTVAVCAESVERVLRLLEAISFELLCRGAIFTSSEGQQAAGIVVNASGDGIPLRIQEIVREGPRKPRTLMRFGTEYVDDLRAPIRVFYATGRLVVIIGDPRSFSECAKIREGKRPLEARVSEVVMMVFTLARLKTHHQAERARAAQEAAERERRLAVEQRRAQAEEIRLGRLRYAIETWHDARLIRRFVSAACRATELHELAPDELTSFREWAAWALRIADGLDPIARGPQRLLDQLQ